MKKLIQATLVLFACTTNVNAVQVMGAVHNPLLINETVSISQALERSEGLRKDAYPMGAMLLRRLSLGDRDQADVNCHALLSRFNTVQLTLSAGVSSSEPDLMRRALQDPLYVRMPVQVDPLLIGLKGDLDQNLVVGDILYIPSRPLNIAILDSDISDTGTNLKVVPYRPGTSVEDYLDSSQDQVGMFGEYIVLWRPDGVHQHIKPALARIDINVVPPGSIIARGLKSSGMSKCMGSSSLN